MRFRSIAEIRQRESTAIARGTPAAVLMERAGGGLAGAIARLLRAGGGDFCLFVAGHGNNGGDAFVAARLLETWGVRCEIRLTAPPDTLKGAARNAWEQHAQCNSANGVFDIYDSEVRWNESHPTYELPPRAVVVDALLGTGARGEPTGVIRAAIAWINRAAPCARIVAVDLPSGLNADTGTLAEVTVQADLTVTFDAPKRGFQCPGAWQALGRVETIDIGLTDDAPPPSSSDTCDYLSPTELARLIKPRPRDSHKGRFGHLLVIGGSRGFSGAPALAALAALRTGAGLVSAVVPECAAAPISALAPEAMAHPLPAPDGCLDLQMVRQWKTDLAPFDTLVVGPGLGTGNGPRELVAGLLAGNPERILLDADALNILALQQPLHRLAAADCVILTPHPGEAARLLGTSVVAVQADRPAAVRQLADAAGAVVVLKGCATLVCAPGGRPSMNLTGNPGMATGGSGDVLSGVIGALWGQGLSAWDAACLGVYLHSTAGDLAAWQGGEAALIARDIIAHLGGAFNMNGAGL